MASLPVLLFLKGGMAVAMAGTTPAGSKWVGPVMGSPLGGQVQTTIYYGPWKCSQAWMDRCQRKCGAEGFTLMGCIWLADIKTDWQARFSVFPVSAGGRLAITHCCCNYPKAADAKSRRSKWEAVMRSFRKKWGEEFGTWPTDAAGNNWHGHHIWDLGHGGDPILLEQVSRDHFPNPPATPEQIDEFERRVGWRLDPDLRAFYLHCDGAELFERPNSPYRFLPLSRIIRARIAIRGKDEDSRGPASWYVLCDVGDGNYILVDASDRRNERYPLIDGYREMFPDPEYCERIASSFSEFLERALRSGGQHFWLEEQQSGSIR